MNAQFYDLVTEMHRELRTMSSFTVRCLDTRKHQLLLCDRFDAMLSAASLRVSRIRERLSLDCDSHSQPRDLSDTADSQASPETPLVIPTRELAAECQESQEDEGRTR